jgi:hypothetical protein
VNSPYLAGVLLPEHVCGGIMDTRRDLGAASGEDSSNGRGGRFGQTNGLYPAMRSTTVSQQFGSATESFQSLPTSYESIHGTCLMLLSTIYFHSFFKFSIIARVPLKNLGHKTLISLLYLWFAETKMFLKIQMLLATLVLMLFSRTECTIALGFIPYSLQKYPQVSQGVLMSF